MQAATPVRRAFDPFHFLSEAPPYSLLLTHMCCARNACERVVREAWTARLCRRRKIMPGIYVLTWSRTAAYILIFANRPYRNKGIDVSGACSQEEEFPGETYLLPLAACHGEDVEASEAGGYQLPIECQVSQTSCRAL